MTATVETKPLTETEKAVLSTAEIEAQSESEKAVLSTAEIEAQFIMELPERQLMSVIWGD